MKSPDHITIAQLLQTNVLPVQGQQLDGIVSFTWSNFEVFTNTEVKTSFYSIILGRKGRRKAEVGGHSFIIKPHTVSIIPTESLFFVHPAEDDFEAQVLLFDAVILKNAWMNATVLDDLMFINPDYPPTFPLNTTKASDFGYKLNKIGQEIADNTAFGIDMIRLYLLQLLYDYNRICEVCLLNSDSSINRKFQIMHQFRQLVDKQFKENKTVGSYAEQLYISPKYLSECVVDQLGYPASTLIHNRIIQEAIYLLKYTKKSIKEISSVLNFDTATHFSRFLPSIRVCVL